jgi:transcriptional regulator with XRE-family HTH domain
VIVIGIGNMDPHAVLRAAWLASGFTTNQLANIMGMHRSTLSRYLYGEQPTPKPIALAALTVAMCSGITVQFESPFKQLTMAAKRARIT